MPNISIKQFDSYIRIENQSETSLTFTTNDISSLGQLLKNHSNSLKSLHLIFQSGSKEISFPKLIEEDLELPETLDLEISCPIMDPNVVHGMFKAVNLLGPSVRSLKLNGDLKLEILEAMTKDVRKDFLRSLEIRSEKHLDNWKFVKAFKELRVLRLTVQNPQELNEFNEYLPELNYLEVLEVIHPLNASSLKDRSVIKACI